MYTCKYFSLKELLPKEVYVDLSEAGSINFGWWILDERALKCLDLLREEFGTIIVNDWKWGGNNQYRGFRPFDCEVGAKYSQHKFGRGFDCVFKHAQPKLVSLYIMERQKDGWGSGVFRYITWTKVYSTWLHFDVRNLRR